MSGATDEARTNPGLGDQGQDCKTETRPWPFFMAVKFFIHPSWWCGGTAGSMAASQFPGHEFPPGSPVYTYLKKIHANRWIAEIGEIVPRCECLYMMPCDRLVLHPGVPPALPYCLVFPG